MSNMVTRDEIKVYNRIKSKLDTVEKGTQTCHQRESKPIIIFAAQNIRKHMKRRFGDDDGDDDCDDDADDADYDYDDSYEDSYEDEGDDGEGDGDYDDDADGDGDDGEDGSRLPRKKLREKYNMYYNKADLKYYQKMDHKRQKLIDETEQSITRINNKEIPLRFRILESDMDIRLKALAISKVDQLAMGGSSENVKLHNYIDNLCRLPIGKYHSLPVSCDSTKDQISSFLDNAKNKLDTVVYGHKDAKDQIIRLLAKWISNPKSKGLIVGIEGVHGIGKTSLVKDGICQVLGLPFGFVTLGGISDGSYMVGHSYTYEGSRWGKIADILMNVKCMNPVLYFDELDKISGTTHGEEIANLLIHLTDTSQNDKFQDKYFAELDMDLSRCIIIFSYNNAELINPILRDRMVTIKAKGYTNKDKVVIARDYMMPKIRAEFGFEDNEITFDDSIYEHIINRTQEEQGVRNMKRSLEEIASQLNLHRLLKKTVVDGDDYTVPIKVTKEIVNKFIVKSSGDDNTSLPMMYM
jgi:ATP-dependent Lon protease